MTAAFSQSSTAEALSAPLALCAAVSLLHGSIHGSALLKILGSICCLVVLLVRMSFPVQRWWQEAGWQSRATARLKKFNTMWSELRLLTNNERLQ